MANINSFFHLRELWVWKKSLLHAIKCDIKPYSDKTLLWGFQRNLYMYRMRLLKLFKAYCYKTYITLAIPLKISFTDIIIWNERSSYLVIYETFLLLLPYWPKSVCCQVIYIIDNSFSQHLIGRTVQIISIKNISTRHVVFL